VFVIYWKGESNAANNVMIWTREFCILVKFLHRNQTFWNTYNSKTRSN